MIGVSGGEGIIELSDRSTVRYNGADGQQRWQMAPIWSVDRGVG